MRTLRTLRWLLPIALALLLAACASGRLQSAGQVNAFDMTFDTTLDWTRTKTSRRETWTIDGVLLNRLLIYSKTKPGEDVFQRARERKSRPDGPWFRAGMRLDEMQKLIVDGLIDNEWVGVTSRDLRPHRFGNVEGIRFDVEMTDPEGLIYRGTVAAAERNGLMTLIVWVAPKEYYHDRDAAAVDAMLDGMRFK